MPGSRQVSKDGLPPLRDVIAAHGLAAKKSLGQNFLLDLNLTARIARAAGAADGGVFYEVGPGPGGLTRALLQEGADKVIAVERDRAACRRWKKSPPPTRASWRSSPPTRWSWMKTRSGAERRTCRRQPALQCRHRASDQMADGGTLAALLGQPHPDVPAGSGRAHHRQAGQRALRPAVGAGAAGAHARKSCSM